MDNEKISFNDLCKSCDLLIPKPFLDAIEKKYKPEECINILTKSLSSNESLKVIEPILLKKYINSNNSKKGWFN